MQIRQRRGSIRFAAGGDQREDYCVVYMGGFAAYIKIDSRPTPKELFGSILSSGWSLKMVPLEWRGSKEQEKILELANLPQKSKHRETRAEKIKPLLPSAHGVDHLHSRRPSGPHHRQPLPASSPSPSGTASAAISCM